MGALHFRRGLLNEGSVTGAQLEHDMLQALCAYLVGHRLENTAGRSGGRRAHACVAVRVACACEASMGPALIVSCAFRHDKIKGLTKMVIHHFEMHTVGSVCAIKYLKWSETLSGSTRAT